MRVCYTLRERPGKIDTDNTREKTQKKNKKERERKQFDTVRFWFPSPSPSLPVNCDRMRCGIIT